MKNLKKCSLLLIALFIVTISACNHATTGSFTGSDKQPLNITIAQNESIKFEKTNSSGRTIVATPFSAKTDLTFYLWGKAQSGQTLAPRTVTVTSDDGVVGKVILDIDCYNWSLTLAACDSDELPSAAGSALTEAEVLEKAVLIGYGNVDMMFTNQIKFTLTPKGLSKTGSVNLTLNLESGTLIPDGYVATAYIYDITTGDEIKSADTTPASLSTILDIDELEGTGAAYTANAKDIKPGTYRFQVEFVKANENRKYVWNDTIIILPGKTVTQTITIPNLVGTVPAAPSSFAVQFNKYMNNQDVLSDEAEEATYPGFYVAHFTWNGSAVTTEMNFAMQIAEVADSLDVTEAVNDATKFEAIFGSTEAAAPDPTKANAKYAFNYLNDIRANTRFYKGGSLFANSTYVDVYLELGKRYVARLYSENNAGYSTTAAYLTITPVESGATLNTINRYRVKYVTQGGTWNTGTTKGSEVAGSNRDKIVYWSQSDEDYDVLNPVQDSTTHLGTSTNPYLYNGPADWIYWIQELATGTKYPDGTANPYAPIDYDGFKNLTLYAAYSREGDVEIYNDSTYDIQSAWVGAFGIAAGSVSKISTNTVGKAANLSNATTTTVSVTLPSANTWKYDKVALSITYAGRTYINDEQVGAAAGSANTFNIALGNLPTGYVYNCLITAQYQMTTVSYPFTVYLTD
ncbi:MAG: hypothetical protein J6X78_07530 [Treponema sp.]|nr:hypothetical protein [Treponema sp.]